MDLTFAHRGVRAAKDGNRRAGEEFHAGIWASRQGAAVSSPPCLIREAREC